MPEETGAYRTPGVYISEKNAFPISVVGVPTAVPVFIGYTQFAGDASGRPLYLQPVSINSLAGFEETFGGAFSGHAAGHRFNLHLSMGLFFANGGGACWVVSVGSYWDNRFPVRAEPDSHHWRPGKIIAGAPTDPAGTHSLLGGINAAGLELSATMIVIPEACTLTDDNNAGYNMVVQAMLSQASALQDRVAILDLPGCLEAATLSGPSGLLACQSGLTAALSEPGLNLSYGAAYAPAVETMIGGHRNVAPPSAIMAGLWARNDARVGVWNAPANMSSDGVSRGLCALSDEDQAGFNLPANGQAINILRTFPGPGTLVWGARTLDGNSQDFRYIPTRRTLIYVEQSIKIAARTYVFEPNVATTWSTVTAKITDFLMGLWQSGGLQGAKPEDAFSVQCGLGSTMTGNDVLEGVMRMTVLVAIMRPAEFMEVTFQQQMQQS
jgi:phage tail sheath protein FI